MSKKQRVLIYDIETAPLKFWGFRTGEQVVRHGQLDETTLKYGIICICYKFSNSPKVHTIHWGDGPKIIPVVEEFDKVIKKAQDEGILILGKNNKRFDDKHVNTQRWLSGLPPMPDWVRYTEDLERQIRKYMYLPSNSLDAISRLRGLGGKNPMEFSDWVNISNYKKALQIIEQIGKRSSKAISQIEFGKPLDQVLEDGDKAFKKMIKYCKKDVKDTDDLFKDVEKHCEWKRQIVQPQNYGVCKQCASNRIRKNGTRGQYQAFLCTTCGAYAGRAIIKKDGSFGKLS